MNGDALESAALEEARIDVGLSVLELWLAYVTLGGELDMDALTAALLGVDPLRSIDHDMVVHALNEMYSDQGLDHPLRYVRA